MHDKNCKTCRIHFDDQSADERAEFIDHQAEIIAAAARRQANRAAKDAGADHTMLGTDIWREVGRKLS
jgi:hypothetical protein